MKKVFAIAAVCAAFAAIGGVPVKWSVETSRADERVIEVYHGESLDMEVTFKSYGKILTLPTNEVAATFWQTNGMNTAYWRTNNVEIIASNGIMRTTFGPEQDVGAKTLRGFIGIAGQIYRAAFVLRFKDAPGFNPTIVEWPYRMLDFNSIEVVNAPYYTKNEVEGEYYSKSEVQSNYYSKSELDVMLEAAGRVQSVNSKTGAVEIAADDVGAYPATKVSSWTGYYYKGNENLVIQKSNNNMLEIQDNMISIAEGIQGSDPKIATYRTDMVFRQRGRNQ